MTLDCRLAAPGLEMGWYYPSVDMKNEEEITMGVRGIRKAH